jgi:tetratricopeptide (TPR) repeat protein
MATKLPPSKISKLRADLARNPRLFVPLAHEYLQSDQLEEAIPLLLKGLLNYPDYVAAWGLLGQAYLQKKKTPAAREAFQRIVALNPSHIQAHKKLALLYQEEGALPLAIQAFKAVLSIDPSDREAAAALTEMERPEPVPSPPSAPLAAPLTAPLESVDSGEKVDGCTEAGDLAETVVSPMLASLYLHQGHHKEAAAVYQALQNPSRKPSNERSIRRLRGWLTAIQAERIQRLQIEEIL